MMPEASFFYHIGNHKPSDDPDNQHMVFNKAEFIRKTEHHATEKEPSPHGTLLQEIEAKFTPLLRGIQHPDHNRKFNSFNDYLSYCNGKPCLQGPFFTNVGPAPGKVNHLDFAPHVIQDAVENNMRSYVRTSLPRALMAHRSKLDRRHKYGHNKPYGTRATACFVHGSFKPLLQRVGLAFNNTPELACSIMPLPIHTIYEVKWNGPGISNAQFELTYDEYKWE